MPDNLLMPTVDTLKAYESLIATRIPEDQAKAILELVKTSQESGVENLVTKAEFKEEMAALRLEMQANFSSLRSEMQANFSSLRSEMQSNSSSLRSDTETLRTEIYRSKFDLLKWLIPFLLGQLALTITVLFKLIK